MTTITIDRAVLEQALAALQTFMLHADDDCGEPSCRECAEHRPVWNVIKTIYEALDAPQPEPVAFFNCQTHQMRWAKPTVYAEIVAVDVPELTLYAAPPRREWVGLTGGDISTIYGATWGRPLDRLGPLMKDFARAVEAKLKERNHDARW
jgi:hypothetical protein